MQRKILPILILVMLVFNMLGLGSAPGAAAGQPGAPALLAPFAGGFTYQGQLKTGAGPVTASCNFQFSLFDALAGGHQVGATQTINSVAVTGGLFVVTLDDAAQFGVAAFDGEPRWLAVTVKCPSDANPVPLSPRQPLTAAPYALSLAGLAVQQTAISPNLIGGNISNTVTAGVHGATIGGGGYYDGFTSQPNRVTDNFGFVGGGMDNRAGNVDGDPNNANNAVVVGGEVNWAKGALSFVGGGNLNLAGGSLAFVGGGNGVQANGYASTVVGGETNTAAGDHSSVGGGSGNYAGGEGATVPGGEGNSAIMTNTLAAGHNAQANHDGAFVWADDSTNQVLISTGPNQFLIRATGGVGIGTNRPTNVLHVVGSINATVSPSTTVMQIENTATGGPDVLALRDTNVLTPNSSANFITFFGSNSTTSLGAIEGNGTGGVALMGPGSDFAEYLPKQSAGETLAAGDIVGVRAGRLSHQTDGADQVLVISTGPIVAGNAPGDQQRDGLALAALVGQAEVRVSGGVAAGDFIVPSGKGDGAGLAVSPAALSPAQAAQIVGLALASGMDAGLHTVRVAVGLPRDQVWAKLLARQDGDLRARVTALEKQTAPGAQSSPAVPGLPGGAWPWLLFGGLALFNLGALIGRRWAANSAGLRLAARTQSPAQENDRL